VASFGDGLKREREKKKITLDQVAGATKISVRMLRALEEEKFDQLPGGIFNKGFVRAYARHLGLDAEQAVTDYLAASTPAPQPEDLELRAMAEQNHKKRQRQARLSKNLSWGWVATVLVLIALGFSVWSVRSERAAQSGKTPTERAAQANNPIVPESPVKSNSPLEAPASRMGKDAPLDHAPAAGSEKPPSPSWTGTGGFTVRLTAEDDSWLSIVADGKKIFHGTLLAPHEQLIHANGSIFIRAGNLGGLDIDFNGMRLAAQGKQGEARTLVFDSSGLRPYSRQRR
jgi:cytoskeletal protein RodZ